ncbi:acyl-CoA thioesterase [bacterium]|nr:acyl-CoA thioesterase [bacterium]
MENFALVRPEHLNHHGALFGGVMLKWVDEFAWLAATREYPGCTFVTVGMDRVEFKEQVQNGAILRFYIRYQNQGKTSVSYTVDVEARSSDSKDERSVFSTRITFVRVDHKGNKCRLSDRTEPA